MMSARFDIFSTEAMQDPHPLFSELRRTSPVCPVTPEGWWAVSRHDDVVFVLKHPDLFSSSGLRPGRDALMDPRLVDDPLFPDDASIISSDPPVHGRLRKLVNGAFAPRAMQRLEARVHEITSERIEALIHQDRFDMLADLAVPLPVTVIAEMLGVDPADQADFKRWSDDAINVQPARRLADAEVERILRGRDEFRAYFEAMIHERRARPRDDLVSELCHAEPEGESLSADEVLAMTILLLIAGNETTTNLIGNGTLLLLQHPEAMRRLRADPGLIPGFLEEVLRYNGPVKMLTRRATADVTLSGTTVPRGAMVAVLVAAANRDPDFFPDPDRFDICREGRGHITFGFGIHFCVGAPLARMEARIAFGEILRRVPPFSREPGRLAWAPSIALRGLRTLPLRFDAPATM